MSSVVPADRWRGVASEEVDEYSASVAGLLRKRSRRLLVTLARPYSRALAIAGLLILIRSGAYLAIPYLVGVLGSAIGKRVGAAALSGINAFWDTLTTPPKREDEQTL